MAFFTVRSERKFCERLRHNLLFVWYLQHKVKNESFHPTTFTRNRGRLSDADAAQVLLQEVVKRGGGVAFGRPLHGCRTARGSTPRPRTRASFRATSGRRRAGGLTGCVTPVQSGAGIRGRAPPARDASVHHRPGGAALLQGQAAGGAVLLLGPTDD